MNHIVPAWRGGSDEPDNLESLCAGCHAPISARDSREAVAHYAKLNKRRDLAPWQATG